MFAAVFRSAVAAPRPLALRSAIAPLALRAYSTPAGTPPPTSESSTPSPSTSQAAPSQPSASGSGRPLIDLSGARKRFSPNEDPDAWWRAESAARRFGVPGNQYTGRSHKVVGGFMRTFSRMQTNLNLTGFKKEAKRQKYHERPSEIKRRRKSERIRRRFQTVIREKVQLVQMLRSRK
ncbi:hypothetical protein A1Q2_03372 [Trichosporon asahii var. asahii CBS 8904]|uniref:Ribosomal protein S21 n=2 Tax=Trichosporon asahii var. asahii TaxID=189963 RepID=K1VNW4_TRIAC|nr:hypothetical protein A1Q1_00123 [Trichosporon asahii var. asahii CBS 2479]EJT53116.1 hypothetical protein A1Q1_00123 [Trichosporon asahii var. asahii CBS 2479]EKD02316.1 hypothetical protein A1Q2_03372 [Trichosporon asahii var. asahii CBS 8904]